MTSVPRQLAIFAAVLAVLFAGGYAAGQFIDEDDSPHAMEEESHEAPTGEGHGGGHEDVGEPAAQPVRGLSDAEGGLRLTVPRDRLEPGRPQEVRFQILTEDGSPLTDYDVVHEKRMHLILVRRDMAGFQHLHPELDESGTWTATARFPAAGSYRLFADFSSDDTVTTLAGDVTVGGQVDEPRPLPEAEPVTSTPGGYSVRLDAGETMAGDAAELAFAITRDGEPVETEPYLGAGGHLVALREGDLAFLHVHPDESGVAFEATFPTAGRYRLFLQFRHEGVVRTAEFTHEVR